MVAELQPLKALPAPRPSIAYRRPLADLWLRPWFDRLSLRFLRRTFFPLSRAWAAAEAAEGDPDSFHTLLGRRLPDDRGLARALALTADQALAWRQAERRWSYLLFGGRAPAPEVLVEAERRRAAAAQDFMAARRFFSGWRRQLPAAQWAVAGPAEVQALHGARLADPAGAYPEPAVPAITRSAAIPAAWGTLSWLRFDSPVLGDQVTVRMQEPPRAGAETPTLILLHGIGMEDEMWRCRADSLDPLLAAGWRILRPEGPWHGRRRPFGFYGGEPVLARGLEGFLTLLQAWVAETAVALDWARRQGGPVALAGISLGSLTAQLYASAASRWSAGAVPDALFLIATCCQVKGAAYDGALARALGLPQRLAEAGWDEAALDPWIALVEPQACAVPSGRTVLLLGRADRVTPFAGGCLLAERWQVPPENLFIRRQGHFSVSLGLSADPAPLRRLAEVVGR